MVQGIVRWREKRISELVLNRQLTFKKQNHYRWFFYLIARASIRAEFKQWMKQHIPFWGTYQLALQESFKLATLTYKKWVRNEVEAVVLLVLVLVVAVVIAVAVVAVTLVEETTTELWLLKKFHLLPADKEKDIQVMLICMMKILHCHWDYLMNER